MADGHLNFDTKIDASGFSTGLKSIAGGMTVAIGAAGAAFAGVSKLALDSVASLEQNIGGVETLFKDSAQTVIDNANKAFQTAGLSANEYMENVTSFSASLLQSVSNDTAEAARVADMAMIDMSDNANKMGTDMESIQNAYQGFAKQNYTMLDNLKLGYGGTKTEMERLLADAQKITGVEYDISNLSDVYEAIHVIQGELGITGTTAEEAATTIEGSMNSAKAAFDNFLNGSGTAEEFAASVVTAAQNVVKNLEEIVPRLAKTLPEAADILVDSISEALSGGALDRILSAGTEMISGLIGGIATMLPNILVAGIRIIRTLAQGLANGAPQMLAEMAVGISDLIECIVEWFPDIVDAGIQIVNSLIQGIAGMLPSVAPKAVYLVTGIVETIIDNLPLIVNAGIDMMSQLGAGLQQAIPEFLANALPLLESFTTSLLENVGLLVDAGIQLIYNIVDGLVESLPMLIEYGPTIIKNLADIINQNVPKLIIAGANIILKLIDGIVENIPNLIEHFPEIIQAIIAVIGAVNWVGLGKSIITGIANGIKNLASNIPSAIKNIATKAFNAFRSTDWLSLGRNLITNIVSGITGLISKIPTALTNIGRNAMTLFKNLDWKGIGKNIISGIASGISGAAGEIMSAAKEAAQNALNSAKRALGIASPSKRARKEVGQMYGKGLELGILDEAGAVKKASKVLADNAVQEIDVPDYTAIATMARNKVLSGTAVIGKRMIETDNYLKNPDSGGLDYSKLKTIFAEALKELDLVVAMDGERVGHITTPIVDRGMSDLEDLKRRGC